jgi:hypothetical protein
LALTSPTGGGRSVGIVRSRTKATEFSFFSWFYYKEICYDARSHERRIKLKKVKHTLALGLTQPLTQMSTRNISWARGGGRQPVRRAGNLTTFMCRFSLNLGFSASWNPQGLSMPVMGLLSLF